MGYTRQAVALGFALLGLAALGEGRTRAFILWIAIGATFHKSAVLLLYYLLLADASEALWQNYVEAQYESQGGLIRVLMNVVPALLLIAFRRRLVTDPQERRLWLWMAVFALLCLPLVPLASTAVDRLALYLIPIQLFVFARIPRLATTTQVRTPLVLAVVAYYAAVLYIWLHYAAHAEYWVPYQFMPLW